METISVLAAVLGLIWWHDILRTGGGRLRLGYAACATIFVGVCAHESLVARDQISRDELAAVPLGFIAARLIGLAMCADFKRSDADRSAIFLGGIVGFACLALASVFFTANPYIYHGVPRLSGLFNDPNLLGHAVTLGLLASLGLENKFKLSFTTHASRLAALALPMACLALMAGLLGTFSRGAWLALMVGSGVWATAGVSRLFRPLVSLRKLASAAWWMAGASLAFVACAWDGRHSEITAIRRLFSIWNPDDLSWRHRVAGWVGQCELFADNLWTGVGWDQRLQVFRYYYLPSGIDTPLAFDTNDFLVVAGVFGIGGLVALGGTCCFALLSTATRPLGGGNLDARPTRIRGCLLAMLAALTIGFVFNGLLFEFYFAAIFFTCLDLVSSTRNFVHPGMPPASANNPS